MKALALIALFAGTASAAPIAELATEVDGTPLKLELSAEGVLRIGQQQITVAPSATAAVLAIAHSKGKPLIVVDVTSATAHEAIVLELAGTWREVIRFPIGGVGLDSEFGKAVDATANGVVRYQTLPGARCDGRPSYLFPELLDVAGKRFVAIKPRPIDPSAPAIAAHVDREPASAPVIFKAVLASMQASASDAGGLAIPHELDDGRDDTVWRASAGSDGRGQYFTFKARVPTAHAAELRIVAGDPAAPKVAGRPRELGIASAGGVWRIELPDAASEPPGTAFVADLPPDVIGCVTVVIDTTYGGPPTAIAELEIFEAGERASGGPATLAHVVAEGGAGAKTAEAALVRQGAAGAAAIDGELANTKDAAIRRRLIRALVGIRDPAAAADLARAASSGWVRDHDLLDVIAALGALGQQQELHDLAATGGLELDARVAAAAGLRADATGWPLLGDLAGKGPREVRHAVIEALASASVGQLAAAAQTATTATAAGDLWRAVTRRVRVAAAERTEAIAAMTAALPAAADYERRYRLVDGLATFGDAAALHALDLVLRGLPASPESAALRQVAIKAIASAPRAEATPLVVAAAGDPDPGVRLAALAALAGGADDPGGPWHAPEGAEGIDRVIATALAGDRWPEVRRRAAEALATRCDRSGPAKALAAAVAGDADVTVRGDSLAALVQCRAADIGALLARTWDDAKAPLELRARAVDLVVALGDHALAAKLVDRFAGWRNGALESKEALTLAQNAAAAIGRLAPPHAAEVLMSALDDSAFPEIVTAAALGLGALGPACPAAAKSKLNILARSEENEIVIAARRAAAQCGH